MLFNSNTKQAIGVAESPINSTIFFPPFCRIEVATI